MGYSVFLLWISFGKYLSFTKVQIAQQAIKNTTLSNMRAMTGILPLWMGVSFFMMTQLYESFRFYSVEKSFFTLFYVMHGDTMFDTYYGIQQIGVVGVIWSYLWISFSIFVIDQVNLAIVEDGYLTSKNRKQYDWLTKPTIDPLEKLQIEQIAQAGNVTIPQALK